MLTSLKKKQQSVRKLEKSPPMKGRSGVTAEELIPVLKREAQIDGHGFKQDLIPAHNTPLGDVLRSVTLADFDKHKILKSHEGGIAVQH